MRYYPHFILAMRRSRGFASTASNIVALFRLAFASAPRQYRLTWLETVSRRIIMQKARRHPWPTRRLARWAPTACRHVVSGSVSSPGRGSSHLSLALLVTLSVASEYLALRDGPRRFEPASTCPVLLRCRTGGPVPVAYRTITFCGRSFQSGSARNGLGNSHVSGPTTPPGRVQVVWAIPRSLAATDGVAVAFFSWGY
jgi:hypothetical protein